jgi:hypothetical protein
MAGRTTRGTRTLWLVSVAVFLAGLAVPARAQFWKKKDYHHWSEKECRKLLSDSPWAKTFTVSTMEMPRGDQGPMVPGRQALIQVSYTALFFSALPARQAQVRLGQIESHYDRMTAAQKKAFDENGAHYLAVPFPTDTVIQVTYSTNVEAFRTSLLNFWQLQETSKLRNSTYLHTHEQTIPLVRYQVGPKNQPVFYLFFPRNVNGEPLLDATHKSLTLQVTRSVLPSATTFSPYDSVVPQRPAAGNIIFEFDVRKMLFEGKIAY